MTDSLWGVPYTIYQTPDGQWRGEYRHPTKGHVVRTEPRSTREKAVAVVRWYLDAFRPENRRRRIAK